MSSAVRQVAMRRAWWARRPRPGVVASLIATLVTLCTLPAVPVVGRAQRPQLSPTAEVRRAFIAVSESLRVVRATEAERQRRLREVPRDTIREGALLLAVDSPFSNEARAGAQAARERLEFRFGAGRLTASLRDLVVVIRRRDAARPRVIGDDPVISVYRGLNLARSEDRIDGDERNR